MTTTIPVSFKSLLKDAKQAGCIHVKIQICENWNEVMEISDDAQKNFKAVQIKTRIKGDTVISKVLVRMQDHTLTIRVGISDGNILIKGLK